MSAEGVLQEHKGESNDRVPSELYHYTSRAGLIGILTTGVLHAGHASFMNDTSETDYAISIGDRVRRELGIIEDREQRPQYPFFLSLSEDGDLLSQWQAYAENGSGYSICFDLSPLGSIPTGSPAGPGPPSLGPVRRMIYEPAEQRDLLRSQDGGHFGKESLLRLKDPAFKTEREWRFFVDVAEEDTPGLGGRGGVGVMAPAAIQFKEHPKGVKPYVTIRLDKYTGSYVESSVDLAPPGRLPIKAITCGHGSSSPEAINAVRLLLRSAGYRDDQSTFHPNPQEGIVQVAVSKVPLA